MTGVATFVLLASLLSGWLTPELASGLRAKGDEVYGEWVVHKTEDELTGEPFALAYTLPVDVTPSEVMWPTFLTQLAVRVTGGKVEVLIKYPRYMSSEFFRVEYRFDSLEVQSSYLNPSTVGSAGFFLRAEVPKIVESICRCNRLVVRAYDYRDTPHTEVFSLSGAAQALSAIGAFP